MLVLSNRQIADTCYNFANVSIYPFRMFNTSSAGIIHIHDPNTAIIAPVNLLALCLIISNYNDGIKSWTSFFYFPSMVNDFVWCFVLETLIKMAARIP